MNRQSPMEVPWKSRGIALAVQVALTYTILIKYSGVV